MNKEDISLIINCQPEDIKNIDVSKFDNNYARIYFNAYSNNEKYLNDIIESIGTEYYSIWDYNSEYKNINNLKEISINKSYIENPDISVIVCLYNTLPKLFEDCIYGLVNQTYKNFEVLIVNDGSDKYYEENKQLINQLHDNRFIWINKEHSGKSQTLNLGIEKSRGKYIAINDSDDISFSNRLEYQYNWLEENIEYDYISNNMVRLSDMTIFPNNFKKAQEVSTDTIHYCTNHPVSMFNKDNVLNKIPFLFSQFYDSYEDCIFHYMCFHNGVKMFYDNKILLNYAYSPETQVHYENIHGFKHDAHYKITYRTFNINRDWSPFGIYLILFDKKIWTNTEIEKTLLNIRISSDNVNIYILYNDEFDINKLKSIASKYGVLDYKLFNNQYNVFKQEFYDQNLQYIGIISKPCRFYQQEWDIHIRRKLDIYSRTLIQPLLFDIEKIDDNTYKNESAKLDKKYTYGERLTPLCKEFTESNDKYYINSTNEYLKEMDIPLLSNDNIFFVKNDIWKLILNNLSEYNLDIYELSNVFISYALYNLTSNQPKIDIDQEIGTIKYTNNIQNYYSNYQLFIYTNLNETIYLHEQLFKDIYKEKHLTLKTPEIKSQINEFLKRQNKQSWNL